MSRKLEGKVALITGGSRGIGAAVAGFALVGGGALLTMVGMHRILRDEVCLAVEALQKDVEDAGVTLEAQGGGPAFHPVDLVLTLAFLSLPAVGALLAGFDVRRGPEPAGHGQEQNGRQDGAKRRDQPEPATLRLAPDTSARSDKAKCNSPVVVAKAGPAALVCTS